MTKLEAPENGVDKVLVTTNKFTLTDRGTENLFGAKNIELS